MTREELGSEKVPQRNVTPSPKADVHSGTARQRNSWGSSPSIEQRLWTARCSSSKGGPARARVCPVRLLGSWLGSSGDWTSGAMGMPKRRKESRKADLVSTRVLRKGSTEWSLTASEKMNVLISSLHISPSRSCRAATAEARRKATHVTAPTPACIGNST